MKTRLVIGVVAALAVGCGTAPSTLTGNAGVPEPPVPASRGVSVGSTLVVEPPASEHLHDLDTRERREQIRDWAVLAAIGRLSTTPEQAAAATYELPPARLPYLDELYTFEYGRGRRAYLGNRVLLFRDADDPDPQTTIGRLADRVRMENGEIPGTVEVYLVSWRDDGQIAIERAPDIGGPSLFSPEYGYVQGEGGDPEQLAAWLAQADDLTFAQLTDDGRLMLGGRRFAHPRTPNLTVEDIAALYQAHEELDQPRAAARARLGMLEGRLTFVQEVAAPSRSPGFSLDPEWLPRPGNPDQPAMLGALRTLAADPCGDLRAIARQASALVAREPDPPRRTSRAKLAADLQQVSSSFDFACKQIKQRLASDIDRVAAALDGTDSKHWDSAFIPYHELMTRLAQSKKPLDNLVEQVLKFHEADSKVQCARYEGTAGTRVGMVLFYTDLLAKLWESTDYGLSAPVFEVPGFLTAPQVNLPAAFLDAARRNPGTRLWFGPRPAGVSRLARPDGMSFAFDHRFTRVYAAGNNPARPGVEEQPREDSRRTLGWWDRHFDAVADYEPQYHLQNQIMKWTMVTAALTQKPVAGYLRTTTVSRDLQFADWQRANRTTLRFSEGLPAAHATIAGKECIPIIASYDYSSMGGSYYISGGVSTVAREAAVGMEPLDLTRPLGTRKPYVPDLGGGKAGTATRAHAVETGARVTFDDAEHARAILPSGGELKLGTPEVVYEHGATPNSLLIKARGDAPGFAAPRPIGELSIESAPDAPVLSRPEHIKMGLEIGEPAPETQPGARMAIEDGDAAARSGKLLQAAHIYETIIPTARSANDLARLAEADVVHDRPAPLLEKLHQLEHAKLSMAANEALLQALEKLETPAVARRVKAVLAGRAPLNDNREEVSVDDHKLVVTRDLTAAEARPLHRALRTKLSRDHIYIDGAIRAAHDGLLPDVGGSVARFRRIRGTSIQELDATKLGVLPDRIRTPDGRVFDRADRELETSADEHASRIFLIRQCIAANDNDGDDKNDRNCKDDQDDKNDDRSRSTGHGS